MSNLDSNTLVGEQQQLPTLAERMRQRKENYLLRLDTHIDMFNQTLTRNAPVLSQLVSALTVGYALYEGVAKWIGAPTWVAVIVGIVAAGAIETMGFMAVDERDQGEAHNRRTADASRHVDVSKANTYVSATFWITLSIVAVVEALPAVWGALMGTAKFGEVLFRCSLLLFPLLSRLGAQLYAFRSVRLAVDTTADDQELRALALELKKKEMVAESDLKVKSQRQNMRQKQKLSPSEKTKNTVNIEDSVDSDAKLAVKIDAMAEGKKRKTDAKIDTLYEILREDFDGISVEDLNKAELGRRIQKSRGTVSNYLDILAGQGRIELNGHVKVKQ